MQRLKKYRLSYEHPPSDIPKFRESSVFWYFFSQFMTKYATKGQ